MANPQDDRKKKAGVTDNPGQGGSEAPDRPTHGGDAWREDPNRGTSGDVATSDDDSDERAM